MPMLLDLASQVATVVVETSPSPGGIEQGPEPEDVKAGWTAFAIFFGLCGVVALLCWSFVRQIGKARAAKESGVYGDAPSAPRPTEESAGPRG